MDLRSKMQAVLEEVAAPMVRALGLEVVEATPDRTTLRLPVTPALVHSGGVVCGQALMAAADSAMIVAVCAGLGEFRPMTTVQLQTSFLRPVPGDSDAVTLVCNVLRRGRTLAFGEVQLLLPDGRLAAHTTTTYTLL